MDIITQIEKQKRKFILTVNETYQIIVPYSLFMERSFQVEDSIDLEEYEKWLLLRQYKHGLNRAVAYLAPRARSEKEVYDKLVDLGYLEKTAQMVVVKLLTLHLLDDEDFALQWIESRHRKKIGKHRITQELRKKGISSQEIELAFLKAKENLLEEGGIEDIELSKALSQGEKLLSRYQKEPNDKKHQKLLHSLVRRGFDWETAKKAVTTLLKNEC